MSIEPGEVQLAINGKGPFAGKIEKIAGTWYITLGEKKAHVQNSDMHDGYRKELEKIPLQYRELVLKALDRINSGSNEGVVKFYKNEQKVQLQSTQENGNYEKYLDTIPVKYRGLVLKALENLDKLSDDPKLKKFSKLLDSK